MAHGTDPGNRHPSARASEMALGYGSPLDGRAGHRHFRADAVQVHSRPKGQGEDRGGPGEPSARGSISAICSNRAARPGISFESGLSLRGGDVRRPAPLPRTLEAEKVLSPLREDGPPSDGAEDGEEFQCAEVIDSLPGLKHWVRNVAKHPRSFCLPTASDKFYPGLRRRDGGRASARRRIQGRALCRMERHRREARYRRVVGEAIRQPVHRRGDGG